MKGFILAGGIALAEDFADDEDVAVILGDNIIQNNVKIRPIRDICVPIQSKSKWNTDFDG